MHCGVFLCFCCAEIHKGLAVSYYSPVVRSILLDVWSEQEVQRTEEMGNAKWNAIYERLLPLGLSVVCDFLFFLYVVFCVVS